MAEYKICPVCHTINPPAADVCECGYRFVKGDMLTDEDLAKRARKKKLRAAAGSCVVLAVIAVLVFLTMLYGVKVLLYVLSGAVILLVAAFIILKLIGVFEDRRGGR